MEVKCRKCGREYVCLPHDDYYHTPDQPNEARTTLNGICEPCLFAENNIKRVIYDVDELGAELN